MYKILLIVYLISTTLSLIASETFPIQTPWGEARQRFLVEQGEIYNKNLEKTYPTLRYPISQDSLAELFSLMHTSKIELVGYGSLVNPVSAAKTVSQQVIKTFLPVVCFGGKRIFERNIAKNTHWGPKVRANDNGMLNVTPVKNLSQMFNGVSMQVSLEELMPLTEREIGYDLIPILTLKWEEAVDQSNLSPHFFISYTFSASTEKRGNETYISACINPVPGYSYSSMAGASEYGEAFLKFWIDTTYLADRKTPFILWLKNPKINCECDRGCLVPVEKKS
ncbi:MAG: hypothetical protein CK425_10640 [Parachlamydia sp.]|nr:MAG: hypothetical protein CK425_10640 [Parachlamydia sp.]